MDNAVQALYMAAGTMIALMILSVFVYMFRIGGRLGETYEQTQSTAQVTLFNSQFDAYAKTTQQLGASDGYSFTTKGSTASDIITCANLAITQNERTYYNLDDGLQVIVKIEGKTYSVFPHEYAPKDAFIVDKTYDNIKSFTSKEAFNGMTIPFYEFLKTYNSARMVDITSTGYKSTGETIYEYYFDVNKDENGVEGQGMQYSTVTGRVNKIVFQAVKTNNYEDNDGDPWRESV